MPNKHYSAYPTANKLLSQRWEERRTVLHYNKLSQMKPSIDNNPPKVYPHLELRLRKLKNEQDRIVEIKRKNQILLDRIQHQIVKKEQKAPFSRKPNERNKRQNTLVTKNMELQKRVASKSAHYSRYEWLAERRRNLGYLKNIAHFPQVYYKLVEEFDNNPKLVKKISNYFKLPEVHNSKWERYGSAPRTRTTEKPTGRAVQSAKDRLEAANVQTKGKAQEKESNKEATESKQITGSKQAIDAQNVQKVATAEKAQVAPAQPSALKQEKSQKSLKSAQSQRASKESASVSATAKSAAPNATRPLASRRSTPKSPKSAQSAKGPKNTQAAQSPTIASKKEKVPASAMQN